VRWAGRTGVARKDDGSRVVWKEKTVGSRVPAIARGVLSPSIYIIDYRGRSLY
jgi:hypothetical protein